MSRLFRSAILATASGLAASLICTPATPVAHADTAPPRLRVASYNIAHKRMDVASQARTYHLEAQTAWTARFPVIADRINESQAAVIGLQENRYDELGDIAPLVPQYRWLDGINPIGYDPAQVKVLDHGSIAGLAKASDGSDLPLDWALIERKAGGARFVFSNMQLPAFSNPTGAANRAAAAKNLVRAQAQINPSKIPAVFVCDCNMRYGETRAVYRDAEATIRASGLNYSRKFPAGLSSVNAFGRTVGGKFYYGLLATDPAAIYDRIWDNYGASYSGLTVQPGPTKRVKIGSSYYTQTVGILGSDHHLVRGDLSIPVTATPPAPTPSVAVPQDDDGPSAGPEPTETADPEPTEKPSPAKTAEDPKPSESESPSATEAYEGGHR